MTIVRRINRRNCGKVRILVSRRMDRDQLRFGMFLRGFYGVCARRKYGGLLSFCVVRAFHKVASQDPPAIPLSRLKQSFRQQYLTVTEGHACIIADCPICQGKESRAKIYINKMTGFFVCNKCRCTGSSDVLQKFLTPKNANGADRDALETLKMSLQVQVDYREKWESMRTRCKDISSVSSEEYKAILQKLSLPSISQTDMQQLNCIYESLSNTLYFPVVGLDDALVGYKSLTGGPEGERTVPPAEISGCIVYREQNAKIGGFGVVVETIGDLLALASRKAANTILCLPYKLQHLPQEILPSLEAYRKLVLWFGNDEASWYMARHFAKKLGEKRCHFVRPTELQPRPRLALDFGYDLKEIVKSSRAIWHESITTFHHLRQDVLSDLQNVDKVQGIKWKRYPSLNKILKGHRRGEFTVLTGTTGSGKTTFTSEYSLDLAMQGVNTLWGSFEIRNTRLARTMLQQMAGVSLADNLEHFDVYADAFEKLPIYFMTFHGQQSIKVVMEAVEHATYVHDIAHVIIDNVQFMMGSDEAKHMDRFWKQDSIVGKFRNFATKYNCHVTVIIHPRKERENEELTTSSIFGGAKATQEADNVLIIQDKRLSTLRGKKFLQIAKNRYSGDLGIMMLDFDKTSLSFAQKKKPKSEDAEKTSGVRKAKEDS